MRSASGWLIWITLAVLTATNLKAWDELGKARAEAAEARNLLATFQEQRWMGIQAQMACVEAALANLSASIDRRFVIPLPLPEPELIGKPVSPQPPTTRPSVLLIESPFTRAITLPEPERIEEE